MAREFIAGGLRTLELDIERFPLAPEQTGIGIQKQVAGASQPRSTYDNL
jgi:hypothetical protein